MTLTPPRLMPATGSSVSTPPVGIQPHHSHIHLFLLISRSRLKSMTLSRAASPSMLCRQSCSSPWRAAPCVFRRPRRAAPCVFRRPRRVAPFAFPPPEKAILPSRSPAMSRRRRHLPCGPGRHLCPCRRRLTWQVAPYEANASRSTNMPMAVGR